MVHQLELPLCEIPTEIPAIVIAARIQEAVATAAPEMESHDVLAMMGLCIEPPTPQQRFYVFLPDTNRGELYLDTYAVL